MERKVNRKKDREKERDLSCGMEGKEIRGYKKMKYIGTIWSKSTP